MFAVAGRSGFTAGRANDARRNTRLPNNGMKLTKPSILELRSLSLCSADLSMAYQHHGSAEGKRMAFAGVTALLLALARSAAAVAAECPNPSALDQRLDQKLLAAVPGITRAEFQERVAKQNSDFGPDAGGTREELFLPAVDDGTRSAYAPLWCKFGPDDRLVSCEAQLGRRHIQRVSVAMLADVKVGDPLPGVEAKLCLAEARQFLPKGGVTLEYSVPRADGRHGGIARVYLRFAPSGRLESKEVRGQ